MMAAPEPGDGSRVRVSRSFNPGVGELCPIQIPTVDFPWRVARVLQPQENEWVAVGFESGGFVRAIWLNGDESPNQVRLNLSFRDIGEIAAGYDGCRNVLILHNHPGQGREFTLGGTPSSQDMHSMDHAARALNAWGIAVTGFVCVHAIPYEFYHRGVPDHQDAQLSFCMFTEFPALEAHGPARDAYGRFVSRHSRWARRRHWRRPKYTEWSKILRDGPGAGSDAMSMLPIAVRHSILEAAAKSIRLESKWGG